MLKLMMSESPRAYDFRTPSIQKSHHHRGGVAKQRYHCIELTTYASTARDRYSIRCETPAFHCLHDASMPVLRPHCGVRPPQGSVISVILRLCAYNHLRLRLERPHVFHLTALRWFVHATCRCDGTDPYIESFIRGTGSRRTLLPSFQTTSATVFCPQRCKTSESMTCPQQHRCWREIFRHAKNNRWSFHI